MTGLVWPIFIWWLMVSALGWAAVPLARRLVGGLPDRGLGLARPLGLLMAGYLYWLGGMAGLIPNNTAGAWAVLGAVVAVGAWLGWRDREVLAALWREKRALILGYEALFATALVLWSLYRAFNPNIETSGGEKYMEMMFINSILASLRFPPNDGWMAGQSISYYYFGYVMAALMIRLTGVLPAVGFTLLVPSTLAMTLSGAFGLGYNLVGLSGGASRAWRVSVGALTGLFLAGIGSLHGLLELAYLRGWGPAAVWDWLNVKNLTVGTRACGEVPSAFGGGGWWPSRHIWWWRGSRVIHDDCREVIHEFPFFSFMLADVHPHLLALPFTLLVLSLALALLLSAFGGREDRPLWSPTWLVLPWAVGALGFLNAWDLPTFAFITVIAYGLATWRRPAWSAELSNADRALGLAGAVGAMALAWRLVPPGFGGLLTRLTGTAVEPRGLATQALALVLGAIIVYGLYLVWGWVRAGDDLARRVADVFRFALWLVLLALLFYLPFHLGFRSQVTGLGLVDIRTRLPQWLVHFGLLAFLALSLIALYAPLARRVGPGRVGWAVLALAVPLLVLTLAWEAWTALLLLLVVCAAALVGLGVWRAGGPAADDTDVDGTFLNAKGGGALSPQATAGVTFALVCITVGLLLPLGTEFLFVRDLFGTRMNTIFKLYFQAWTLLAVAGGFTFFAVSRRLPRPAVVVWAIPALLLVAASLLYPLAAVRERTNRFSPPSYGGVQGLTLDGLAWWRDWYPGDLAAVAWLRANARGPVVILEAPGGGYSHHGRISMATGFPTVMGWDGHEHQWRGERTAIDPQKADAIAAYTTNDPREMLQLLEKYDARYVVVGNWERDQQELGLTEADMKRFETFLKPVFENSGTVIYERP